MVRGASALNFRLQNREHLLDTLQAQIPESIKNGITPALSKPFDPGLDLSLWLRMLFSCLVDADFLDTEFYMSPERAASRGSLVSIASLASSFDGYIEKLTREVQETYVNQICKEILNQCRKKRI